MTVKAHCFEETSFSEIEVGDEKYLEIFMDMKNQTGDKYANLRKSADAAALLVSYHKKNEKTKKSPCGAARMSKY